MKRSFIRESGYRNLLNALIQGTLKAPFPGRCTQGGWQQCPALFGGSWDLSPPPWAATQAGLCPLLVPIISTENPLQKY